jgi:hypothetical protein
MMRASSAAVLAMRDAVMVLIEVDETEAGRTLSLT